MRIGLVGDWPPPFGGVSVHVRALERGLTARGVDVRVLDIGKGDHRERNVVPARGQVAFARELAWAAARGYLLHVHTSGANPKSWLVALAASRARLPGGARGVLTLHSGLGPAWLAGDHIGGPDRQRAAHAHGVAGVDDQVEHGVLELARVAAHRPPNRAAAPRSARAAMSHTSARRR